MSLPSSPPAVLLIGHGSRDPDGVREFHRLADDLRVALADRRFGVSFLELAEPSIGDGLRELIRQGATRITVLPGMLLAAGHLKNDIPCEIAAVCAESPAVEIRCGVELGLHPALLQAAQQHILTCEAGFGPGYTRRDTLLLVVGRGTTDSDVNSTVVKLTRLLWEALGFGRAATAYCAMVAPGVAEALDCMHGLGWRRLIVFPHMLFTGHLIRHIDAAVEAYRNRHPDVSVVRAPYLNDHPLIVRCFLERLQQVEAGDARMNCLLCQYRERIVGYEHRQGLPQTAHAPG